MFDSVCRASANYCELSDEPVCGEDGVEYTNACIARVQGIKIAYHGECGLQSTGTLAVSDLFVKKRKAMNVCISVHAAQRVSVR